MLGQKDFTKIWAKIKLNSIYCVHRSENLKFEYDENKVIQITKEGRRQLNIIKKKLLNL